MGRHHAASSNCFLCSREHSLGSSRSLFVFSFFLPIFFSFFFFFLKSFSRAISSSRYVRSSVCSILFRSHERASPSFFSVFPIFVPHLPICFSPSVILFFALSSFLGTRSVPRSLARESPYDVPLPLPVVIGTRSYRERLAYINDRGKEQTVRRIRSLFRFFFCAGFAGQLNSIRCSR